ncbi:mandelate racemase/muconate lactonizing enzyme family protein [Methylobacterium nodulans]|uniref:Mandelate racemase/muconate lactonizing protein n=1 Tax=Methylobacterium nodulans (strain LMG 21967 / CNCM I-2342 / ORS 2060) TaxID=460265 RepID=B8IQJ1_METNO|nr:enolase C-terminal domain-like protein [Methylobacterium nodulans]ACL60503.1 Mandelate racemase/muconate lactonizing protein [Methylobacterium nodulans ORS 2060]
MTRPPALSDVPDAAALPAVTAVEAMHCRIPFPSPLQLGKVHMTHRDYVLVRLLLADGGTGHAIGFERGMPLLDLVTRVAPFYVGRSPAMRAAARRAAEAATPPARAVLMRGISLLDIAMWDALARNKGLPLWALLGGARRRVPVMPVVGYGASAPAVAEQCRDLAGRGFRTVKVMIDGSDLAADAALLDAVRKALPDEVAFGIDAHWSWTTIADAMPTCRRAEELGAIFIEDPFLPQQWRTIAELQTQLRVPLAVGEDVIDRYGFRDLAEAARILRVDASVSGGVTGAIEALHLATIMDREVIPHVFPALHGQLAAAFPAARCVEMILPEVGADPVDRLFAEEARIEGGDLLVSETPGAAIAFDWDKARDFALRSERVGE